MARHAHNDTGTVAHQDVVGNKHRNDLSGSGVRDLDSLKAHAGLVLVQLTPLEVGFSGGGFTVSLYLIPVCDEVFPLHQKRMLRRDDHVGHTEKRVCTCGEDGDIVICVGLERDLATSRTADPVLLLNLDTFDKVQIVKIVDQAVSVLGNTQHPLALLLANDRRTTTLTHTLDDLFVCETNLTAGTPVDRHGGLIRHPVLEQLQEDPLGPFVIVRVGGVDHAVPVKTVTQHFELTGKVLDVLLGDNSRMDVVLDRVVLSRQTKSVETDREQNVVAFHSLLARNDIDRREGTRMTHVQTRTGGVRELDKPVKLGLLTACDSGVWLGVFPSILPLLFNGRKIVFHE